MSENTNMIHEHRAVLSILSAFICLFLTDIIINNADLTISALPILTGFMSHISYGHIPVVSI